MRTRLPAGTNIYFGLKNNLADCIGIDAVVAPPRPFDHAQTQLTDGKKAPEALRRGRHVRILELLNSTALATVLVKTTDTKEVFVLSMASLEAA